MTFAAVEPAAIYGALVGASAIGSLMAVARYERRGLRTLVQQLTERVADQEDEVTKCERRRAWSDYRLTAALQYMRQSGTELPPWLFQEIPAEGAPWPRFGDPNA